MVLNLLLVFLVLCRMARVLLQAAAPNLLLVANWTMVLLLFLVLCMVMTLLVFIVMGLMWLYSEYDRNSSKEPVIPPELKRNRTC